MNLTLTRQWPSADATIGAIDIDGVFQCYTLERPAVQIPCGTFKVTTGWSDHFNRVMPFVQVPGRIAIEIHWGNFPQNTDGCVLVGKTKELPAFIGHSVDAWNALFPKIQSALTAGQDVWLTVTESVNVPITEVT